MVFPLACLIQVREIFLKSVLLCETHITLKKNVRFKIRPVLIYENGLGAEFAYK